jgi:hypothetical protein
MSYSLYSEEILSTFEIPGISNCSDLSSTKITEAQRQAFLAGCLGSGPCEFPDSKTLNSNGIAQIKMWVREENWYLSDILRDFGMSCEKTKNGRLFWYCRPTVKSLNLYNYISQHGWNVEEDQFNKYIKSLDGGLDSYREYVKQRHVEVHGCFEEEIFNDALEGIPINSKKIIIKREYLKDYIKFSKFILKIPEFNVHCPQKKYWIKEIWEKLRRCFSKGSHWNRNLINYAPVVILKGEKSGLYPICNIVFEVDYAETYIYQKGDLGSPKKGPSLTDRLQLFISQDYIPLYDKNDSEVLQTYLPFMVKYIIEHNKYLKEETKGCKLIQRYMDDCKALRNIPQFSSAINRVSDLHGNFRSYIEHVGAQIFFTSRGYDPHFQDNMALVLWEPHKKIIDSFGTGVDSLFLTLKYFVDHNFEGKKEGRDRYKGIISNLEEQRKSLHICEKDNDIIDEIETEKNRQEIKWL